MRRDGKVYVDKTAYMHRLVTDANSRLFFMSRPRRFGKSLTISALKALFMGRKELFDGLAIADMDWSWERYPVIHFELNDVSTASIEEFRDALTVHVREHLEESGYAYDDSLTAMENFGRAIKFLSSHNGGKGVVVLIDEYDAPVGRSLDDVEKAEAVRARLSDLYSQMKNRAGDIRFMLMTGVSKFTKLSVFSSLNNIVDISQDDEYATMFGYTEEELSANFGEHLRAHAERMGKQYGEYREELKRWYNGFRFARFVEDTVYNPISIAITLSKMQPAFAATWAATGRPSMLMNYLKREDMLKISPEGTLRVRESALEVAELDDLQPIPMLFQSGYLTIRDYSFGLYTLGVPDEEVRQDLCLLMTGVAAEIA